MKSIEAVWTKYVNMLIIECGCGKRFEARMDKWWVICPNCHAKEHIDKLRNSLAGI